MNYEKITNAYRAIAKNNPKDRIEVEIGDTKQVDFYPQVKLMRWDNEVNFSARLLTDTLQTPVGKGKPPVILPPTVSTVADRVVYNNGNITSNFYELPQSDDLPEGGYEFEITLNKKPTSNVVAFSLQTKGLEFFYQPELEDSEVEESAKNEGITLLEAKRRMRPENVVGSYAVYYQNCPANYVGGKEYKTGKAFHIYRPKIQDANGAWTWGELNITDGLMTVTIPQEFLEKAVYPVTHAAGATFGYTSIGGTIGGPYSSTNVISGTFNNAASVNGTVQSITSYVASSASGKHMKGLLNNSSSPYALLGVAGAIDLPYLVANIAWVTSSFTTEPEVTSGTVYCAARVTDGSTYKAYDSSFPNKKELYGNCNYATPTNPTSTGTNTNIVSIYATYTAGGGPAPNTTAFFRMF